VLLLLSLFPPGATPFFTAVVLFFLTSAGAGFFLKFYYSRFAAKVKARRKLPACHVKMRRFPVRRRQFLTRRTIFSRPGTL
jgi:hypothetical protein